MLKSFKIIESRAHMTHVTLCYVHHVIRNKLIVYLPTIKSLVCVYTSRKNPALLPT